MSSVSDTTFRQVWNLAASWFFCVFNNYKAIIWLHIHNNSINFPSLKDHPVSIYVLLSKIFISRLKSFVSGQEEALLVPASSEWLPDGSLLWCLSSLERPHIQPTYHSTRKYTFCFSIKDKYILQFGQIHWAIWTNTFLQFVQIHLQSQCLERVLLQSTIYNQPTRNTISFGVPVN